MVIAGELVDNLASQYVIKNQDIYKIKAYIADKYPHKQISDKALILADAIHRIIDAHIGEFGKGERVKIRSGILKKAVSQNSFNIGYHDIFTFCLKGAAAQEINWEMFSLWLSRVQPLPVTVSDIKVLIANIRAGFINSILEPVPACPVIEAPTAEPAGIEACPPPQFVSFRSVSAHLSFDDLLESYGWLLPHFMQTLRAKLVNNIHKITTDSRLCCNWVITAFRINLNHQQPWYLRRIGMVSAVFLSISLAQPLELIQTPQQTLSAGYVCPSSQNRERIAVVTDTDFPGDSNVDNDPITPDSPISSVMPPDLSYKNIDRESIKFFLRSRNSILEDEPYFSEIIQASKEYNLNPLLLFAVTGQEQSFVPRNSRHASLIANNPFNVGQSWQLYNTIINDSARLAANTIVSLSMNCPADTDPLLWINRHYAQDQQWWTGVSRLLKEMERQQKVAVN